MARLFSALIISIFMALPAIAQQNIWVQIEAQRTLTGAQDAAREYAATGLNNVSGYALPDGWYAVAIGPLPPTDATTQLIDLRTAGRIPADSYLVDGSRFGTQFWPVGGTTQTEPETVQPTNEQPVIETPVVIEPEVPQTPVETFAQAQISEQALSNDAKRELQVAMQWAGFYSSTIDGLFGRGTRQSELLAAYNAILDGMGLQLVRDDASGIEMQIPTGIVTFSKYEPPFAHFDASDDFNAQVLLISQPGDQTRMFGLYEILQTLEIVPTEGPRQRNNQSFEIEGINDKIHSYTYVVLENGQIKGYTVVWPAGDEERRSRVLGIMQDSFNTIEGVLSPAIARPDENQAIDLVAGLEIRKPIRDRSGFYINDSGDVLTSVDAVEQCTTITLGLDHEASVVHRDDTHGLVVLRPTSSLAPPAVAKFQTAVPRIQAEIAVAGFPYGNVLTTPALTFGQLADIRGLNGENNIKRLSIFVQPGDAGGPVFDDGGAVLGMLLPKTSTNGQTLPPEVSFSVDADEIITSLTNAGVAVTTTDSLTSVTPEVLTVMAADMAVLVSCWTN